MNAKANYIRSRLSLRKPRTESLKILQELNHVLELKKNPDLAAELAKVQERYPTCADFERDFVSICFALATGVGKTRLMGAFISYLYLEKGIRNFFVMAPNLTVYEKLITDFSQLVETKSQRDMKTEDVARKTEAALTYCTTATAFTTSNGGKPWKYLLIPHDAVMHNMSFNGMVYRYEVA